MDVWMIVFLALCAVFILMMLCFIDVGIAVHVVKKTVDFIREFVKRWKEKKNEKR